MSAAELAAAIRSWPAPSQDVVAHLRRIAAVNPAINVVTLVRGDQARAAVQGADRAVTAGADLAPWHGVPVTVKEPIDLAGIPTTQGVTALAGVYPGRDVALGESLRAVGAIPLGRTNCPDLGMRWHTDRCRDAAMIEDRVGNITPVDPGSGARIAGGWQS